MRDPARFEIDRTWLARGAIAILVVAFIVILAKASMMAADRGGHRLERHERAAEAGAVRPVANAATEKP